jgi:hypothetical protein
MFNKTGYFPSWSVLPIYYWSDGRIEFAFLLRILKVGGGRNDINKFPFMFFTYNECGPE